MTHEMKFKERGHAWYAYFGLRGFYKRNDETVLPQIKINGSKVIVPNENVLSELERIARKTTTRFKVN